MAGARGQVQREGALRCRPAGAVDRQDGGEARAQEQVDRIGRDPPAPGAPPATRMAGARDGRGAARVQRLSAWKIVYAPLSDEGGIHVLRILDSRRTSRRCSARRPKPMRLPRLLRTTPFRLTLLFLALFAAAASAFLGYIYVATAGEVNRRAQAEISREFESLEAAYRQGGVDALNQTIVERATGERPFLYFLADKAGKRISGSIEESPVSDFTGDGPSGPRSRSPRPTWTGPRSRPPPRACSSAGRRRDPVRRGRCRRLRGLCPQDRPGPVGRRGAGHPAGHGRRGADQPQCQPLDAGAGRRRERRAGRRPARPRPGARHARRV
jgi:hypothetical protein